MVYLNIYYILMNYINYVSLEQREVDESEEASGSGPVNEPEMLETEPDLDHLVTNDEVS